MSQMMMKNQKIMTKTVTKTTTNNKCSYYSSNNNKCSSNRENNSSSNKYSNRTSLMIIHRMRELGLSHKIRKIRILKMMKILISCLLLKEKGEERQKKK